MLGQETVVKFTYVNHRGETGVRTVIPQEIRFASSEFYPEPQWLLVAWDLDKKAERWFSLKDVRDWAACPLGLQGYQQENAK